MDPLLGVVTFLPNKSYIASFDDLSLESYGNCFNKLYEEDGIFIFEVLEGSTYGG